MSIKVNFEIGHEAAIRSKRTIDGFTHDWEVFVRGFENSDIHHFIEKVVFHLHETFPNPKRVVKEPPYRVRESGYAGFNLPIEIYLRNNDEPKKIRFHYDLNLQTTGPAIYKVQKEKYVFCNPSEEFRHKLMKGGGVVSNPSSSDNSRDVSSSNDKPHIASKAKSINNLDVPKKHKKEHKPEDSFTNLFGTPITKTAKISPVPEVKIPTKTPPTIVPPVVVAKPEKSSNPKKSKSKHSPKEKERDKEKKEKSQEKQKHKEEKKNKDKTKEKERKDKTVKREKSPKPHTSPNRSPKRVVGSPKRIPSPKRPPSPPPPIVKKPEEKKIEEPPLLKDKLKTEKKIKYDVKEKEKEKDKKDYKSQKEPPVKLSEPQKEHKSSQKEPKLIKEPVIPKVKEKIPKPPEETIIREPEKIDKPKIEKIEVEKLDKQTKHKHKKKDNKEKREKKEEKLKEKKIETKKLDKSDFFEKVYKEDVKDSPKDSDKNSSSNSKASDAFEKQQKEKRGLNALQAEILDDSSSSSSNISNDESSSIDVPPTKPILDKIDPKKLKEKIKIEQTAAIEKVEKKRKRKHEESPVVIKQEEPIPKLTRDEQPEMISPKEKATNEEEIPQDYMSILKDLQHKIMTLQDNTELQRVVQLIAETGQFEITAQTFDFDLCALDRATVRKLQEFFTVS